MPNLRNRIPLEFCSHSVQNAGTHTFSVGITEVLNTNLLLELSADDIEYVYQRLFLAIHIDFLFVFLNFMKNSEKARIISFRYLCSLLNSITCWYHCIIKAQSCCK